MAATARGIWLCVCAMQCGWCACAATCLLFVLLKITLLIKEGHDLDLGAPEELKAILGRRCYAPLTSLSVFIY